MKLFDYLEEASKEKFQIDMMKVKKDKCQELLRRINAEIAKRVKDYSSVEVVVLGKTDKGFQELKATIYKNSAGNEFKNYNNHVKDEDFNNKFPNQLFNVEVKKVNE